MKNLFIKLTVLARHDHDERLKNLQKHQRLNDNDNLKFESPTDA